MRPILSLLALAFSLAGLACGAATSSIPSPDGGDAATPSDAFASRDAVAGTTPCPASTDGGVACDARTEMCVNDYARVSGLGTDSCQPLPPACASNPTCACVIAAFRCGITTSCEEGTVPLQLVCQPD